MSSDGGFKPEDMTTTIFNKSDFENGKLREEENIFETKPEKIEKRLIKHFSQNYISPLDVRNRNQPMFKTDDNGSPLKREIADKMIDILQNLGNTGNKLSNFM